MRRVAAYTVMGMGMLVSACDMSPPPVASAMPPPHTAPTCPGSTMVQTGDNVYSVAHRCGLSVRELIEANGLQPPYALVPGTVLHMPGGQGEIVVGKGDSLQILARKYHVDFNALAAANHKTPPYIIRLGEHLRLPGSFDRVPPASPSPSARIDSQPLPPQPKAKGSPPPPAAVNNPAAPLPAQALPPAVASAAPPPQQSVAAPPPPPASPLPTSIKGFVWPVRGEILATFGPQAAKGQNNDGINIAAAKGTPILAAEAGVVAYVGNELKGFGNLVLIKHADGWVSAYAHADQVDVKKGQAIGKGQQIGTVGQTGAVTQPQLHFELRHQGEVVDPEEHLPS